MAINLNNIAERIFHINHPDGAHHAKMLLDSNYSKFQSIHDFEQKGFCNQKNLILEPVSRGLGFTVLPAHAVAAFGKPVLITTYHLANPVSETLYLATRRDRVLPNKMQTIIDEVKRGL